MRLFEGGHTSSLYDLRPMMPRVGRRSVLLGFLWEMDSWKFVHLNSLEGANINEEHREDARNHKPPNDPGAIEHSRSDRRRCDVITGMSFPVEARVGLEVFENTRWKRGWTHTGELDMIQHGTRCRVLVPYLERTDKDLH
jgi:hypothetical protein